MKYAVKMGSGAMTYIPNFIKIGSGIQKFIGGIHRQHGDRISLLLFAQNKESRLKKCQFCCYMHRFETNLLSSPLPPTRENAGFHNDIK
jgi:hypothetical protein